MFEGEEAKGGGVYRAVRRGIEIEREDGVKGMGREVCVARWH